MSKSQIIFDIELDKEHVPEKITWQASDNPQGDEAAETKAVSISLWDQKEKHSLRIDLWSKDMPVDEMKTFYIECIAGLGDSVKRSTNDTEMAQQIHDFCSQLVEYVKKTNK
ncbi:MAG: gliding motility protein GldC [Cyclobacteriaceae bacterium]|nr:gliding motility protein GldC [Cyclobacteriaceae bacterium]